MNIALIYLVFLFYIYLTFIFTDHRYLNTPRIQMHNKEDKQMD